MLMDLMNKIRSTLPNLFPVDARKFEDPLASRIEWRKNTGPRLSCSQRHQWPLIRQQASFIGDENKKEA